MINIYSIIREPAPIIFGALHLTMNKHFDMDELFTHLVSADASSVGKKSRYQPETCSDQLSRRILQIVLFRKMHVNKDLLYSTLTTTLSLERIAHRCLGN